MFFAGSCAYSGMQFGLFGLGFAVKHLQRIVYALAKTRASLQHACRSLASFLESFAQVASDKDTWPFDLSFTSVSICFPGGGGGNHMFNSKLTYVFCQLSPSASIKEKHKHTTLRAHVSEMKHPIKRVSLSQTAVFFRFHYNQALLFWQNILFFFMKQ